MKPQNPETQRHQLRYSPSQAEHKAGVSDLPELCASGKICSFKGEDSGLGGLGFRVQGLGFSGVLNAEPPKPQQPQALYILIQNQITKTTALLTLPINPVYAKPLNNL